jgi:hypothetical protein
VTLEAVAPLGLSPAAADGSVAEAVAAAASPATAFFGSFRGPEAGEGALISPASAGSVVFGAPIGTLFFEASVFGL